MVAEYKKYMFDNFVIAGDKLCQATAADTVADLAPANESTEYPQDAEVMTAAEMFASVSPEPVVSYSQDEMDAATRAAEEKGYERGFNNAVSEREQAEISLLEGINNRLLTILADVSTQHNEQEKNALRFAVELVKKILPQLEEQVAIQEVEAFIGDNFKNFAGESGLSFHFNPDIAASVAPKISKLAERNDFEGKIAIHKDDSLGLSDCRIEWGNGGVERSSARMLSQVENLLDK